MATIVKAPNPYPKDEFTLFLGGVIDMGNDKSKWREKVSNELKKYENLIILNPRRDDWDSSWKQSLDNPQFVEQVKWELKAQDDADLCLYVFGVDEDHAKMYKAPITLMDLGLHAADEKAVVCCPESYYRSGNVYIVCRKYNIPLFKNLTQTIGYLHAGLDEI